MDNIAHQSFASTRCSPKLLLHLNKCWTWSRLVKNPDRGQRGQIIDHGSILT